MKRVLTLIVLALFAAPLVGCEASAEIDDNDTVSKKETSYKRTTDDGVTKTEKKVEVQK